MLVFIIFGIGVFTIKCAALDTKTPPTSYDEVYYPSDDWSDPFDWKLFKGFTAHEKNVLISPVSLKIILALLYQGASGSTQREFEHVMMFRDKESAREKYGDLLSKRLLSWKSPDYTLNIGTRIFLDSQIQPRPTFTNISKTVFKTDIEPTNFDEKQDASRSVNTWIEKLTNGRISELVKPEDLNKAVMILANAIYFKGAWLHQFPRNNTRSDHFYVSHNDEIFMISTDFMHTTDKFYFMQADNLDAKIIRLPYKGGRYSMFVVLPNSRGGLSSLLKRANLSSLKQALYLMDLRVVRVTLPKFKFDFQARYVNTLKNFGLIEMFQNTATFTGIAEGNSTVLRLLVVSDIIQKAGIEIDEEGSVIYSSSAITVGNKFGEIDFEFTATHPFLFYVEEETSGTILYIGKVENPLDEEASPLPVNQEV